MAFPLLIEAAECPLVWHWPICQNLVKYEVVVQLIHPQQPSSLCITWWAYPLSLQSMCRFSYQSFLLPKAYAMFFIQGTVNSTMRSHLTESNHITMSGHSWVCIMWYRKRGSSSRSANIFQPLAGVRNLWSYMVCWGFDVGPVILGENLFMGLGWGVHYSPYTGFQLAQSVWRALVYGTRCRFEGYSHTSREHTIRSLLQTYMWWTYPLWLSLTACG